MIIAVVLAKGESRRLAQKNLQEINGTPLFVHAVRYAAQAKLVDRIIVSTDSDEIASLARNETDPRILVVMRGPELCGDASNEAVMYHAMEAAQAVGVQTVRHIACLQPNCPGSDVPLDDALRYAMENDTDLLLSVHPDGLLNGSFRIYGPRYLRDGRTTVAHTLQDGALNIHTREDLAFAAHRMSPFREEVRAGWRAIGHGHPAFLVAEAACNHECDLERAKYMILMAASYGADAVKFQTYKADRLVTRDVTPYWAGPWRTQRDYYRNLDRFGEEEYGILFDYARARGVIAFSTAFDTGSADMLNGLGAPLFKIASCDLPDTRLIRHVAAFGKPVILSTGGASFEEIDRALFTCFDAGNHQAILLACTLEYPAVSGHENIRRIRTLLERYHHVPVGLSDHAPPDKHMVLPAAAVAMGACVIEKHFTLSRSGTGSTHGFACEPPEFLLMANNIRRTELAMGDGSMAPTEDEAATRDKIRRSIVAGRAIRAGETIESGMLEMKRPGSGLPGWRMGELIGKKAVRDIADEEALAMEMVS